jgi:cellulose synthase/poly-beta-1,6-N-acetylglucosamine synthase-like glycosyltransferase
MTFAVLTAPFLAANVVVTPMHSAPQHIGVVIPARNEECLLPRCLRSVLRSIAQLPASVTADIIVVVDSSDDRTYDVACEILGGLGLVERTDAGSVGEARALAVQLALERHNGSPDTCWLANTDADCCVPESWLLDQLLLAAQGVEAVAGIVDVDSFEGHHFDVAERFRTSYILHEDGTHPHVHGANFGVRADAYLRAGGWGSLVTAEDHDLWNRLRHTGSWRLSATDVKVTTSGRRIGRAPHGFAAALAAHNEATA